MYINFKLMHEKGIYLSELYILIAINQKEAFLVEKIPYEYFEEQGLIEFTKQGKTLEDKVRLSKNGKALLDALTTKGATEELLSTTQELVDIYEGYGKETGNILEIRNRLIWFVQATGFGLNAIKTMVEDYVSNSGDYTLRLDNLIWKPQSSAFSIHYSLSDSRLFDLIVKKYNLPVAFFLKPSDKRTARESWLFDIMKMKVPSKLPDEMYWTGSEKGDKEALIRLKKQFKFLSNE